MNVPNQSISIWRDQFILSSSDQSASIKDIQSTAENHGVLDPKDFAAKHPEYDEEKWISIIRKTWNKMSDQAHQFVLAGHIKLPELLEALIQKAIAE